jgi:hypothetical protein
MNSYTVQAANQMNEDINGTSASDEERKAAVKPLLNRNASIDDGTSSCANGEFPVAAKSRSAVPGSSGPLTDSQSDAITDLIVEVDPVRQIPSSRLVHGSKRRRMASVNQSNFISLCM